MEYLTLGTIDYLASRHAADVSGRWYLGRWVRWPSPSCTPQTASTSSRRKTSIWKPMTCQALEYSASPWRSSAGSVAASTACWATTWSSNHRSDIVGTNEKRDSGGPTLKIQRRSLEVFICQKGIKNLFQWFKGILHYVEIILVSFSWLFHFLFLYLHPTQVACKGERVKDIDGIRRPTKPFVRQRGWRERRLRTLSFCGLKLSNFESCHRR